MACSHRTKRMYRRSLVRSRTGLRSGLTAHSAAFSRTLSRALEVGQAGVFSQAVKRTHPEGTWCTVACVTLAC